MNKLNKTLKINPLYSSDGYKVGHKEMLAPNTTRLYGTWIPRSLKYMTGNIKKIMSSHQQMVWRYIHSNFQEFFFDIDKEEAMQMGRDMTAYLGMSYNYEHFEELYDLGYLPIHVQSLKEGIFTEPNIPHMTFINTVDGFAWLTLFLETLVSKLAWQGPITATIAYEFKKRAVEWVTKTDPDNLWLADYMCHDFHARGGNPFTSQTVGLAHAFSNTGSDTLETIPASRYYYDAGSDEVVIASVNASEHSVTTTGIFYYEDLLKKGLEEGAIKHYYLSDAPCEGSVEEPDYRAIAEYLNLKDWLEKFPTGILSIVSDTFDLWKLITFILPRLKKEILARDGKLVIRPDSGDPVDITCGTEKSIIYNDNIDVTQRLNWTGVDLGNGFPAKWLVCKGKFYEISTNTNSVSDVKFIETAFNSEQKGVIELLWDIFGGTVNEQGYKVLDSHIGAIYGDAINLERQEQIYSRLAHKGFASTNIVLGIGSFTYVMLTRDFGGYAAKGAWFETGVKKLDGVSRTNHPIYKDPVTDDGTKKSLKGFQFVYLENGEYKVESEVTETIAYSSKNLLKTIYENGLFFNQTTLNEVRKRIKL